MNLHKWNTSLDISTEIKKQYYQHLGSPLFEWRTQEMLHRQSP